MRNALLELEGGACRRSFARQIEKLHVGWSLWCAYAVWYALRDSHPRSALLSWIFPLDMAAVVRITGNHTRSTSPEAPCCRPSPSLSYQRGATLPSTGRPSRWSPACSPQAMGDAQPSSHRSAQQGHSSHA
ncbi:phosphatase PAP2 family protein [Nonomuraea sp. CA-141351]|uniref:phosphatase PAP2 family protein n=1 Tax=Nonomuraea sp. CA-141351 TaxID=3239996 RepID=UPI003D8CDBD7